MVFSSVYDTSAIYTDILNFPVAGADGKMAYMVAIFFTSRIYQGKSEVAKALEYLENNWREEFDIDSIEKLPERGSEQASNSMKSALFTYLLCHQSEGQIIIIENDIPPLNYEKANVIRFTKDPENGRYGLLESVQ